MVLYRYRVANRRRCRTIEGPPLLRMELGNDEVLLTGIKPTGIPHIANYIGAIRPALALSEQYDAHYFIADYHALMTV